MTLYCISFVFAGKKCVQSLHNMRAVLELYQYKIADPLQKIGHCCFTFLLFQCYFSLIIRLARYGAIERVY